VKTVEETDVRMVSKSKRRRLAIARAATRMVRMSAGGNNNLLRGPPPKPNRQRNRRRRARGRNGPASQNETVSGVDVIGSTTVGPSTKVGTGLLTFVVNPANLRSTRLGQYSSLWTRWAPKRMQLEVCSAAGQMVPGSYVLGWCADASERIISHSTAVQKITTFGRSKQASIGQSVKLDLPLSMTSRWYVFHGKDVDDSHGVILAALAGSVGSNTVTLTFKLHWTITFNGPDLPIGEQVLVVPESDYANVFTDSVSDWAEGKRLTFKHAEGGTVVPWEHITSGVVYTTTAGVKIPYYDSKEASQECKFFSMLIQAPHYDRALVCHATAEDAIAYQKNGDLTKILAYKKAGDWCTPALPTLKPHKTVEALHSGPVLAPQPLVPLPPVVTSTDDNLIFKIIRMLVHLEVIDKDKLKSPRFLALLGEDDQSGFSVLGDSVENF